MTRAAERLPHTDSDQHSQEDELYWDVEGERPDAATSDALKLAHRAAGKFPELAERYKSFAGPAAIASGALVVLAGVAVARRARKGQNPEQILEQITSAEIEQAVHVTSRKNRLWRMVRRIARRRRQNGTSS